MEAAERLARRIKLQDLRVLLAAAESGSLGKAAARLSLSQPAVSKTVSELESRLGMRLLDRSARGVAPTLEGRMLLTRAANIFAELRYFTEEAENIADPRAGELRIACGPIFAAGFLPAVLDSLTQQKPGLRYDIIEAAGSRALRERLADVMVGRPLGGADAAGIEFEHCSRRKSSSSPAGGIRSRAGGASRKASSRGNTGSCRRRIRPSAASSTRRSRGSACRSATRLSARCPVCSASR